MVNIGAKKTVRDNRLGATCLPLLPEANKAMRHVSLDEIITLKAPLSQKLDFQKLAGVGELTISLETIKANNPLVGHQLVDFKGLQEKTFTKDMILEIIMLKKEDLSEKVITECCSVGVYAQDRRNHPAYCSKIMNEMMKKWQMN